MNLSSDILSSNARKYNTKSFISSDPIFFPHQYKSKKDIEISAFISSWIAYGNRKIFMKKLHSLYNNINTNYNFSPYLFLQEKGFYAFKEDKNTFYRFYKNDDFYILCQALYNIYIDENYPSMEDKLLDAFKHKYTFEDTKRGNKCLKILDLIIEEFEQVKGVPKNTISACKRLCMFLRWLVRNDGIVDLGIWNILSPDELIIPLDTHVYKESLRLGLTNSKQANMRTAIEITKHLKHYFQSDPCLFDFALFGYGINKSELA